ncbi:MAG: exodeoxyribonuclease V subunit beta [Chthoniobacteraceae bacterium]
MRVTSFDVATAPLELGVTQLEASAGTGKTYTLAGLFVRLIAEANLEVGSILVTTFTKPATAELRDRIRKLLRGAVAMFDSGPGDHPLLRALHPHYLVEAETIRPRLERALRQFDDALISTIHGFCLRLLEERAFESGLPFDAEPLEDEGTLLSEVASDFWRQRIYPAELRIGAFAMLAELSGAALMPLLRSCLARPTMSIIPPHHPAALAAAEADLRAAFSAVEHAWESGEAGVRAIFDDAPRWAKGEMKKPDVIAENFAAIARCLAEPASCCADYAVTDFFRAENVAEQTQRRGKNPPSPPQHPFFAACSAFVAARGHWVLAFQREFLATAPDELARRKLQRNVLSFNDLLTRLRDALRSMHGSELVKATQQRFAAALVDEFQDTDPVQAEIFHRLFSGHGRLYLIGDPKQAIYGFRGADVFSYLDVASRAQHHHDLTANQRSVTPLVHAVNAIFARNPDAFVVPGIRFVPAAPSGRHDDAALKEGAMPVPPFRFWVWSEAEVVTKGVAKEHLPVMVADAIVAQLEGGETTEGRALRPSDFAVLTVTNPEADLMHAALMEAGLPAVVLSRARVFEAPEAGEMLALLHALAEPTFEPAIRAALATTALGFTANDLAALPDARWEQVLDAFLQRHARWQKEGFFPAFRALLVEEHVRPRLLAMPDGERRLTNLLHIADLLHQAATTQRLGPAALVRWLAMQMAAGASGGEEQELRLESDEEAVKVVTVHKSKGLEFGVVWCPFSWRGADLFPGAPTTFHDPATHSLVLDLGSPDHDAHRARTEHEQLAEQARLLYVALTRAKLQCHFVWGRFNRCENSAASWVLHPPGGAVADAVPTLQARTLEDATLRNDLAALAAPWPDAFAIADVPELHRLRFQSPVAATPPRQAREFTGEIRRDFAIASFSSLTALTSEDARDYDRDSAPSEPAVPAIGIHAFPRGRRAGTCLHEIFEKLDFTDDASVELLVQRKLEVFGFARPELRAAVAANVRATLAVDLAPGVHLAAVEMKQRLNELEFHLPIGRLDSAALQRVLGETLTFSALTGFLKGFIDLVFEHCGKFYIADWKSNWLGATADDYTQEAIAAEMRRHHYGVQYHLYTVALHRYLARRMHGYEYTRHFGGVFYVFLRGVDPARPELGIFRDLPSIERITALDALLSTRR